MKCDLTAITQSIGSTLTPFQLLIIFPSNQVLQSLFLQLKLFHSGTLEVCHW